MKEDYVLTVKAEARPGLLHLITGMIEKRRIPIKSLSYAPTDIHHIILITIEVVGSEYNLTQLALKIENIIEVYQVEVSQYSSLICIRAAYFKLDKSFLQSPNVVAISAFDAVVLKMDNDFMLIAKYGTDVTIQKLYNALEGPHLLGFSQTGLIAESGLIPHDDIERISWLAA